MLILQFFAIFGFNYPAISPGSAKFSRLIITSRVKSTCLPPTSSFSISPGPRITYGSPCRKEMPTLDALQGKLGGPDFQVVAVNIDTRDLDKPKQFLKELNINKLTYYSDPDAKTFQDLKAVGRAFGLPTTLLVDPHGCEIGSIAGPAEWASDDAIKLIKAALGKN